MQDYLVVIGLSLLPALGNFAGGLLAEFTRLSAGALSFALHFAAGIILAVVGIELVGTAMQAERTWLIALAFVAGGGLTVLLDKAIDSVRARFGSHGGSGPWMIYAGVSVDLFSDGVMIGTGAAIASSLALLLALGQVTADVPEGFATIASLKRQQVARRTRMLLSLSFLVPVLLGATIGYWSMRDAEPDYQFALLALTGGVLTTTVVEEMIVHAHAVQEGEESGWQAMGLVGGFALFMLLSAYLEA